MSYTINLEVSKEFGGKFKRFAEEMKIGVYIYIKQNYH